MSSEEKTNPVNRRPIELEDIDETGEAIDARRKVIAIADTQIGIQDPDKYWSLVCPELMGNPHKIAWCGGFALWCLREAGLCTWNWVIYKGPGTPSGFLYHLLPTRDPKPGDIAYFDHMQHHAIVKEVHGPFVDTIDGNAMQGVEGVVSKTHPVTGCTFYSIASLIS